MEKNSASTVRWVIMGVSGAGKSAIGQALATALQVPFVEGDAFHSQANIAKMAAGFPLADADRAGWLGLLADEIAGARARCQGMVLACSALKRRYRDSLREGDRELICIELDGTRALFAERMRTRADHFMPTSLLDSQLADLEPLQEDERRLRLDAARSPEEIVRMVCQFNVAM